MRLMCVKTYSMETFEEALEELPMIADDLISMAYNSLSAIHKGMAESKSVIVDEGEKTFIQENTLNDIYAGGPTKSKFCQYVDENMFLDELIDLFLEEIKGEHDIILVDYDEVIKISVFDIDFDDKQDYTEVMAKLRAKFKDFHSDEEIIEKAVEYELSGGRDDT